MMTPTKFASLACPQTLAAALEPVTDIPVERLTTGTTILLRGGDWTGFAEVYDVQFDGWEGYEITFCTDSRHGWDATDTVYIKAGGFVKFGGTGEPVLRDESAVTLEEWQAKAEMIELDILQGFGKLNELHGHVCREIDEASIVEAVARALEVEAA